MRNQVTTTNKQKVTVQTLIKQSAKELGNALPVHMNPERMCRIALTTLRMTPKLQNCDPYSFLGALFQCAQLGLEPNIDGQAYIIPYGKEATFQVGYKGFIELFYRHSAALSLSMQTVYEHDEFEYRYGTDPHINHIPVMGERGKSIAYYAVAKMKNGAFAFFVWSKDQCISHGKKHSKTFNNGPWKTDLDAMCMKTVLIQLMKIIPKSVEIQQAFAMDNTIKKVVPGPGMPIDMLAVPDETDWNENKTKEVAGTKVEEKVETVADQNTALMTTNLKAQLIRLGEEHFFEIIGSYGYTSIEEAAGAKDVKKVLEGMSNAKVRS